MQSSRQTKAEIFSGIENPQNIKKLGNNTYEYETGGKKIVRFHVTNIITFDADKITLNSGGWKTKTTKERINDFSPARIHQEKNTWFVFYGNEKYDFFDGIVFDLKNQSCLNGKPINGKSPLLIANNKKMKQIKIFVSNYLDLLYSGKMDLPSAGDCLICNIERTQDSVINANHLECHLEENYYVPSMIWASMRFAGAGDYYKSLVYNMQTGKNDDTENRFRDSFSRFLTKYLKQVL